ncbi:MAG: FHA domain-containing protein [Thermomicrobiales bacterium]|nr:FHA domain-containing protein [Thermomicrobiales bacterium]
MDISTETLYQTVRILFAISLLGFLALVIRITLGELQHSSPRIEHRRSSKPKAEILTVPGEEGSMVPEGLVFEIQGVTTIGRARTAKIVLDDVSVSAQHALIRPDGGAWSIEDLGSRNSTLVNGRRIDGPRELVCGDAVQLGRVRLRFMC